MSLSPSTVFSLTRMVRDAKRTIEMSGSLPVFSFVPQILNFWR